MARLINPDGTEKEVDVNSLDFDEVAELLGKGAYVEYHYLSNDQLVLMDEDGRAKNLPRNPTATDLASYEIVGNALLLTPEESEQWFDDEDDLEWEEDFPDDEDEDDDLDDDSYWIDDDDEDEDEDF